MERNSQRGRSLNYSKLNGRDRDRTDDLYRVKYNETYAKSGFQRVRVRKTAQNRARKLKFRTLGAPQKRFEPDAMSEQEGKTLSRPRVIVDREQVHRLQKDGLSVRAIAARLQLPSPPFTPL
jgi:hypothetical protein